MYEDIHIYINLKKRLRMLVSCFVCTQISTPEHTESFMFGPWSLKPILNWDHGNHNWVT